VRWRIWIALLVIVVAGAAARLAYLDRVYVWIDETPILREGLWTGYGPGVKGFLRGLWKLPLEVYRNETDNGTWGAVVFGLCRTVGSPETWWARLPAAMAGVILLPVVFLLTRRVSGSAAAGLFAAGAAAVSVVQIHYAQQALPYGPTVLASALVIWAAVAWVGSLAEDFDPPPSLPRGFLLFMAAAAAALLHNCTLPVICAALAVVAAGIVWRWHREEIHRRVAVREGAALLQSVVVVGLCAVFFVLPKVHQGFRGYLAPYYAPAAWPGTPGGTDTIAAVSGFLLGRAYDLMSYALNPVYDFRWYRPLGLNSVTLLPAALALLGLAGLWRRGGDGRTFAVLGVVSGLLVSAGALARRYPFGGVRQCLPLTVFVYAWAGTGAALLYRKFKPAGIALAGAWVVVWLVALPQFYTQRLSPYDTADLVEYLRRSGTDRLAAADPLGCPESEVFRYYLRDRPEVELVSLHEAMEGLRQEGRSFVLGSTSRGLDELVALWNPGPGAGAGGALAQLLSQRKVTAQPLIEVARNRVPSEEAQNAGQSIYTPLNGLFLYRIERAGPGGG